MTSTADPQGRRNCDRASSRPPNPATTVMGPSPACLRPRRPSARPGRAAWPAPGLLGCCPSFEILPKPRCKPPEPTSAARMGTLTRARRQLLDTRGRRGPERVPPTALAQGPRGAGQCSRSRRHPLRSRQDLSTPRQPRQDKHARTWASTNQFRNRPPRPGCPFPRNGL